MESSKLLSQLVNAHKVSSIIIPLSEAVEVNKRTQGIKGLSLASMLKHVIEVGGEIYESLLDKEQGIVESGQVPDKLFLVLAKSLRNSVILYNSQSLALIKDDITQLFSDNIEFIQRYGSTLDEAVNEHTEGVGKFDKDLHDYVTSSMAQMFMPIWVYHTNLYTSGMVDDEELLKINREASSFMISLFDKLMKRMDEPQGKYSDAFKGSSMFVCAEMVANIMHDFGKKLIKNRAHLDAYIEDPEAVLSVLVKPIYACFISMNSVMKETIFKED